MIFQFTYIMFLCYRKKYNNISKNKNMLYYIIIRYQQVVLR